MKELYKNRKALVVSLCLILLVGTASVIAYLIDSDTVVNTFTPADVDCQVLETFDDQDQKASVKIKNIGNTYAYIRVAVVANSVDEEGNIVGPADVDSSLYTEAGETITCQTDWIKIGNYYYYTKSVAPDGVTGEFLLNPINLTGKQVTILADAIQDRPEDAIYDAWGVKPSEDFN